MDAIRAVAAVVHQVWGGVYFIVFQPPIMFADILLHGMTIPLRLVLSLADIPIEINWDFIKLVYLFVNVSIMAGVCMGVVAGVLMCITRFTLSFSHIPVWIPSVGLATRDKASYFDMSAFSTVEQSVRIKKEGAEDVAAAGGGASDVIYEDDDGYYKKYTDDLFSRVSGDTELTSDIEPDKLGEIPEEEEDV